MNFLRGSPKDDPEINLIPMIDVLLVILIFLMVTTTYSKFTELQINLPEASAEKPPERPNEINIAVDVEGRYAIDNVPVTFNDAARFSAELRRIAGNRRDPVIVINADAKATHQSVINVMEAARIAGYAHITFTTQTAR